MGTSLLSICIRVSKLKKEGKIGGKGPPTGTVTNVGRGMVRCETGDEVLEDRIPITNEVREELEQWRAATSKKKKK